LENQQCFIRFRQYFAPFKSKIGQKIKKREGGKEVALSGNAWWHYNYKFMVTKITINMFIKVTIILVIFNHNYGKNTDLW